MSVGVKDKKPSATNKARKPRGSVLNSAYSVVGVTAQDVLLVPKIEHLFKSIGGKAKVLEYLSGSEDQSARDVVVLRAKLNAEQARVLPFEAYCIAANVTTPRMFGLIAQEIFEQSRKAANLLRDAMFLDIVDYSAKQALTPAGTQERKMFLQSGGMVPVPKTFIMPVSGDVNVDNRQQTVNQTVLTSQEDVVKRISNRFNESAGALAEPSDDDLNSMDDGPQDPDTEDDDDDDEDNQ